jgi:hypothetical protein
MDSGTALFEAIEYPRGGRSWVDLDPRSGGF